MAVYFCTWYFFTITTYGVWMPAGLFLPGIITGGAMGRLYTLLIEQAFPNISNTAAQNNALLGATAMLAGYCRLTYSLTVVMIETTRSLDLYIPMLIAMLCSYMVAEFFNQSLYRRALRAKQVPFLVDKVPPENKKLNAMVIMSKDCQTLDSVPTVHQIM